MENTKDVTVRPQRAALQDSKGAIADLYIRLAVSNGKKDERLRRQEEELRKYCNDNHIQIRKVITEVGSGASFDRREWKSYFEELSHAKGSVNLLLFTSWDRFCRNVEATIEMAGMLRELGIASRAIKGPNPSIQRILMAEIS